MFVDIQGALLAQEAAAHQSQAKVKKLKKFKGRGYDPQMGHIFYWFPKI